MHIVQRDNMLFFFTKSKMTYKSFRSLSDQYEHGTLWFTWLKSGSVPEIHGQCPSSALCAPLYSRCLACLGVQCLPSVCQCMFAGAVRAQLSHVVAPRVSLSAVLAQGVVEHAQQASASSALPWSWLLADSHKVLSWWSSSCTGWC